MNIRRLLPLLFLTGFTTSLLAQPAAFQISAVKTTIDKTKSDTKKVGPAAA